MICGLIILSVLKNANTYFPPFFFCLFTVMSIDLSSLPIRSLAVFSLLISLLKYSSSLRPFFISNLFLWLCYSFHVSAKIHHLLILSTYPTRLINIFIDFFFEESLTGNFDSSVIPAFDFINILFLDKAMLPCMPRNFGGMQYIACLKIEGAEINFMSSKGHIFLSIRMLALKFE